MLSYEFTGVHFAYTAAARSPAVVAGVAGAADGSGVWAGGLRGGASRTDSRVLSGFDLTIKRGATVALVGECRPLSPDSLC